MDSTLKNLTTKDINDQLAKLSENIQNYTREINQMTLKIYSYMNHVDETMMLNIIQSHEKRLEEIDQMKQKDEKIISTLITELNKRLAKNN